MPKFMAGGEEAYRKALRADYQEACRRLEARLEQCSDPAQQQAVSKELEEVKKKFETDLRRIGGCLFIGQ
jgi:hypothetical protein